MITIDGSQGEGGGQVLRTSLTLSMITGQPVRLDNIRAGRKKPGLLRQHLTCVRAAAEISGAEVDGAELRANALTFRPGAVAPGTYRFAVGTAGSANLVLQTVLPALASAEAPSTVVIEGGTHNPSAPSTDFLATTFVPALARFGPTVDLELERHGFYPAGGGRLRAVITPAPWTPAEVPLRGAILDSTVSTVVSEASRGHAKRQAAALGSRLMVRRAGWHAHVVDSLGPGEVLSARFETEAGTMVFTAVPQRREKPRAAIARIAEEVEAWEPTGVFVDEHLADQLLLPLALAGGGRFRTLTPSLHTTTNRDVIEAFLGRRIDIAEVSETQWEISL
jgi:RNA 3'-terminal phosphate cyclase (ATP)